MATGMQGLAPLSAQLLQKLEQQQQQPSSLHDDDAARHVSMNATWSGVSEGPHAAALAGSARPRSVHEILASARQTVGAVGVQKKPSHGRAPLQPHKQPARLSPVQQQAGAKQPRVPSREAAGSSPPDNETLDAFVQRADKTALQGVQEKAQRRAQRLVGQRDPRHGTRRRPAAAALDAAAATQTQMAAKVQARLQERVVTELRKIQKLCPCDAKENSGPTHASSGNGQAPDDVAFLETTLRTLRQHHRQLSEHLRTQQAVPRPAKKAQAAVVQPEPPLEQPRAAEPAAARRAKPDNSAGARAARLAARHSAAARIQHRFRLRASVRAVTRAYEGRLRSMQLELSEARLQRDEAEMRQQVQEQEQVQEQQEQDTPETGDADLLKLQVEQLTAQLAAQTQRADAAEEEVAMWQRAE